MSIQSGQRSQQPNVAYSHKNNPNDSMSPHSLQLQHVSSPAANQQWVAAYIDGQYFLTDPESMNRLKNIEEEIQLERRKLAKLENDNQSLSNSFFSMQDERGEKESNKSFCGTEFNENRHISKKEKAKKELQIEEDQYRQKIRNMEKEKHQMKRGMKLIEQPQVQEKTHDKPVEGSKKNSEQKQRKQSNKEVQKGQDALEGEKQKKTVRRSVRQDSKEKSYHKSRIQKSIKNNLDLNQNITQQAMVVPAQEQAKLQEIQKSIKSHQTGNKSHQVAAISHQIASKKNSVIASEVGEQKHSEQKSVRQSGKQKVIDETVNCNPPSEKPQSVKKSQKVAFSVRSPSKRSQVPHSQKRQSVKKQQTQSVENVQVVESVQVVKTTFQQNETIQQQQENNRSKVQSKKQSQKLSSSKKQQQCSLKSGTINASSYNVKVIAAESLDSNVVPPSEEIKSLKSVHSHVIQQPADIPDSKSRKSSVVQQVIERRSSKSHAQPEVYSSRAINQQIQQADRLVDQTKSKSHVQHEASRVSNYPVPEPQNPQITAEQTKSKSQAVQWQAKSRRSHVPKEQEVKSKRSEVVQREQEVKSKKSEFMQKEEELKSKRSQVVQREEELKSKRSQVVHKEQARSRKPSVSREEDIKSRRSQAINLITAPLNTEQVKSKKSYVQVAEESKSVRQDEVKSRRSQASVVVQHVFQPSHTHQIPLEETKSKKSSIVDQEEVNPPKSYKAASIKQSQRQVVEEKKSERSQAMEQFRSRKASSVNKAKQTSQLQQEQRLGTSAVQAVAANQSAQWSQVSQSNRNANPIRFQKGSEKNSSSIQQNEQSMNESSHLKLQMLNNELAEEQVQKLDAPYYQPGAMRKKKQSNENQSEKKSRSFIIHSRGGSVKERSQKNQQSRSKITDKKKQSQVSSVQADSVTKEEIVKLNDQIGMLRDRLRQIQERQELMEKMEGTISKIQSNTLEELSRKEHQLPKENQSLRQQYEEKQQAVLPPVAPVAPVDTHIETLNQLAMGMRPLAKLQIESSTIQVNTHEDYRKKLQKQGETNEKLKLKEEISRLKRIIRDMQIEKIKSIDHDNDLGESGLINKDSKHINHKQSRVEKESINSFEGMPTQKRFWGKSRIDEVGRIIKNSYIEPQIDISPKRPTQRIKYMGNQDDVVIGEPDELPFQSNAKRPSKLRKEAQQLSMIERIHDKEKDFHHFVESSRVFAEEGKNEMGEGQQIEQGLTGFNNFSKISVGNVPSSIPQSGRINYSRLVQQFRKNNPQQQQVLPEIHIRDIKIPQLPNTPNPDMTQQQLLSLAKQTYQLFGTNVDQQDRQLCVKKYKNCVVFTLTNSPDYVLWHFSGKFYMGGWKSGQPGEGEKHGQGLQVAPEKHVYRGQFLNGKKNGTGILKQANGNIYDGQWIEGAKNGRGVYFDSATRVLYSGEWKDGRKDGQGFLKLSEKQYYYGTFVRSVKQGFGSEVFVNGDRYRGEYRGGKFHGKGKYTWANGSCYQGQFVEGVRQGQGSWKSAKTNGDIYIGTYESDKKNGYGRYVWANGCTYEGGFANDVKHGKGRLTYQDGKEIKGVWEEGNLVTTENERKMADHEQQPLRRSVKVSSFGGYHPATARKF